MTYSYVSFILEIYNYKYMYFIIFYLKLVMWSALYEHVWTSFLLIIMCVKYV